MKKFVVSKSILLASAPLLCALPVISSTRLSATPAPAAAEVAKNGGAPTPLDLSTPEKTVRRFVSALNADQLEEAARCVDGGMPRGGEASFRRLMSGQRLRIALSALTVSTNGESAVAKAKVTFQQGSFRHTETGNVALTRRDSSWRLVPLTAAEAQKASEDVNADNMSALTFFATALHLPGVFDKAHRSALRSSCASNLKQIALVALELDQDKGRLAMTPQNFKTQLSPYLKTMQLFRCPSVESGESYSFNGNLANYKLGKLSRDSSAQLVLFYEGQNGKLAFRHLGRANVAFADGHVKAISREQAKKLRWKP